MCPDAGKAVGLKFEFHGGAGGTCGARAARGVAHCIDSLGDSEELLDVVPHLVGDDIRLRKIARVLQACSPVRGKTLGRCTRARPPGSKSGPVAASPKPHPVCVASVKRTSFA